MSAGAVGGRRSRPQAPPFPDLSGRPGRALRAAADIAIAALAFLSAAGCEPDGRRGPAAATEEAPAASRNEEWFRLLLNGQPAGYARQVEEPVPGGGITTSTFQRIVVRRGDQPMAMEVESLVEETARGAVVKFRMVQRMAESDEVTEGVVQGDRLLITARGLGNPRQSNVPYDSLAVGPHRLNQVFLTRLRKPGDSVSQVTFYPEKNACGQATASLVGEETVEFPGGPRRLQRRTIRIDILPGSGMEEWFDGEGKVWKTSLVLPVMRIETWRSNAEEILREKYASPPEIFYSSSIRPRPPLDHPGASEVLYRFTLKSGDFRSLGIERLFRGTGQTVVKEDSPSSRTVRIARVLPGRPVPRPVAAPPGLEESLAPNIFIQSDDPLIVELAREAAGAETDAFETARRLERWVREHVKFKDLKTPFASAKEVAQRREGDCTEHGVLLAALARAAGIPARVVSGLVWYDGSFVGHLWTEVWIDRWVPLDATRGRGEVGPDHLAITESTLGTSSAADLFFDMIHVIGNLGIEVLEEK